MPDARRVLRARAARAARRATGRRADLVIGNNVLAQVPDLNDFVAGVQILLAPTAARRRSSSRTCSGSRGAAVRHDLPRALLVLLVRDDPSRSSRAHGLDVVDVEELSTHGGSLRVFAQHARRPAPGQRRGRPRSSTARRPPGFGSPERYARFAEDVKESKRALLDLLIRLRREGKQVAGYGAPGKGNTLLNYCGIRTDLLDFTVDRNPYKHGLFTPGTHIPIHPPEHIAETRPDYLLVLPWNLVDEISPQLELRRGVGREAHRPDPAGHGHRAPVRGRGERRGGGEVHDVKVVLFCGGLGVRMGEATAAHPEADGPDRGPADALAHHEVLRPVGAHRLHPLPRLQGRASRSTSSTTTRRCRTTSCSRTAGATSSCSAPTSPTGGSRSSTPARIDDRRAAEGGRAAHRRRRSSSRPTATASPTRRSTT